MVFFGIFGERKSTHSWTEHLARRRRVYEDKCGGNMGEIAESPSVVEGDLESKVSVNKVGFFGKMKGFFGQKMNVWPSLLTVASMSAMGYLGYVASPIFFSKYPVTREREDIVRDSEILVQLHKIGKEVAHFDNVKPDLPNWGFSPEEYVRARAFIDGAKAIMKPMSEDINNVANLGRFKFMDLYDAWVVWGMLTNSAFRANQKLETKERTTYERILKSAKFPPSFLSRLDSQIYVFRVGFPTVVESSQKPTRQAVSEHGCTLVPVSDSFGFVNPTRAIHEVYEVLDSEGYSQEQQGKIDAAIFENFVVPRFKQRKYIRSLAKQLKKFNPNDFPMHVYNRERYNLIAKLSKANLESYAFSLDEGLNFHSILPDEISRDFRTRKSLDLVGINDENTFSKQESSILQKIHDNVLGTGWDSGWGNLTNSQFQIMDYDANNINNLVWRRATFHGLSWNGVRQTARKSEYIGKIVYLDAKQKFNWMCEDNPYQAMGVAGLLYGAGVGLAYPLAYAGVWASQRANRKFREVFWKKGQVKNS